MPWSLFLWKLSFKTAFSLSSFTFIKRCFSSSFLSVIGVMSSAYLRLLVFLPAILIPACEASRLTFHMIYSSYKLNKPGDNTWHTPFPILNQSVVTYSVLAVASWPSYRFLRRQVRWSGIPISLRIFHSLCDPHSQRLEHSQGNLSRWFFWGNSFAFSMIYLILAIWSLVSLPFLNSACTIISSWFMYCWSLGWRILSFTLLCMLSHSFVSNTLWLHEL